MNETTPIYDAINAEFQRTQAINNTAEMFSVAAEETWPEDRPFETTNVPTEQEWRDFTQFLSAKLMEFVSTPDFSAIFFPDGKVGDVAVREGELRAVGYTVAAHALAMIEYPEWEDAE